MNLASQAVTRALLTTGGVFSAIRLVRLERAFKRRGDNKKHIIIQNHLKITVFVLLSSLFS